MTNNELIEYLTTRHNRAAELGRIGHANAFKEAADALRQLTEENARLKEQVQSAEGVYSVLANCNDTLRSRGFGATDEHGCFQATDIRVISMAKALDAAKQHKEGTVAVLETARKALDVGLNEYRAGDLVTAANATIGHIDKALELLQQPNERGD